MPVAVVLRAPLRIRKYLVGFVEFLEALLGVFVAGIAVGMKLNREAAVGFLEFFFAGAAIDAENFVIVAFFGLGRHQRNSRLHSG